MRKSVVFKFFLLVITSISTNGSLVQVERGKARNDKVSSTLYMQLNSNLLTGQLLRNMHHFKNPINNDKKIEVNEMIIVTSNPLIKNSILERPVSNIYRLKSSSPKSKVSFFYS